MSKVWEADITLNFSAELDFTDYCTGFGEIRILK